MKKATIELAEKAARRYQLLVKDNLSQTGKRAPRVITISRIFGAGGITVSGMLGKQLGYPVWDREILEVLASESEGKYQSQMFAALDERSQGIVESFLSSFAGHVGKDTYLYLLQRALLIVARSNAIILGRAANLLVPGALRVFLQASMETRIKNVMKLLSVGEKQARQEIKKREEERQRFLKEVRSKFAGKQTTALDYDLELNTDSFDFENAVVVIRAAADVFFGS